MVKVSFNSSLGLKDPKKDCETLIPEDNDPEVALPVRHRQSKAWCWCLCLGLTLMISGVAVGGFYLYHYDNMEGIRNYLGLGDFEQTRTFLGAYQSSGETHIPDFDTKPVFECTVMYNEEDMMIPGFEEEEEDDVRVNMPPSFKMIQESIRILQDEEVALINVPVPEFEESDPADIVHDFKNRLTAYLDLYLNKCYIIPLNTTFVMPPRDLLDLLINIKAGTYMPQSYLVHEEMMVTERLEHVENLGSFINSLCHGKETYKLERRDRILGMQKREALNCHKIRHFENKFVVETMICDL
ncbi:hypothetical protein DPEC_G00048460 [Dallia pectoralis]|uniref:Uncharacterized protein n=1 Tax=Dallia pectoralis TaxID=75939 RepID=A0ACC2HB48_DALPE|nr:hypothetical protein DPEC_G00048460 [Dallia pectoralis]